MYLKSNNYHDIYIKVINEHLNNYEYINSPRAQMQREKLLTSFTLENPIERVCYSRERRCNIIFQFAEVLWYLSGSNSLDVISYYAPKIKAFSQDGKTLSGTAYGNKIFAYAGVINQWKYVLDELRRDNDSKRAVITIRNPLETVIERNIDVSCTISLQFLIRNKKLNLISTMRANDVYLGALSDVFSFTFIQEVMANELGVDVGFYHHQVASSHLYDKNLNKARKLIEGKQPFDCYNMKFPLMPKDNVWENIDKVLEIENKLRHNVPLINIMSDVLDLPKYWTDIVVLFELYRQYKYENIIDYSIIDSLDKTIAYLTKNFFNLI